MGIYFVFFGKRIKVFIIIVRNIYDIYACRFHSAHEIKLAQRCGAHEHQPNRCGIQIFQKPAQYNKVRIALVAAAVLDCLGNDRGYGRTVALYALLLQPGVKSLLYHCGILVIRCGERLRCGYLAYCGKRKCAFKKQAALLYRNIIIYQEAAENVSVFVADISVEFAFSCHCYLSPFISSLPLCRSCRRVWRAPAGIPSLWRISSIRPRNGRIPLR